MGDLILCMFYVILFLVLATDLLKERYHGRVDSASVERRAFEQVNFARNLEPHREK